MYRTLHLNKALALAIAAACFLAATVYEAARADLAYELVLSVFATRFLGIFVEAVPFLLLGSLTSGFIEAYLRSEEMLRWLPRSRLGGALGGAFLGLVFPVCECGVVPVARRLFRKGMPLSMGLTFLLSAPFMNPIVFASTYIAFGFGTIFVARVFITVLVAAAVGWLIGSLSNPETVLKPMPAQEHRHEHHKPVSFRGKGLRALQIAAEEFFEMGRFLIMGAAIAALMQTIIAQDSLLELGTGSVLSVLFMQILAFILSVCSTVDSFLALAFVNTFTTGAIVSFLSFGPMVDIKSTMMFAGVFRRRIVLYLVLLPFAFNLVAGVFINLALGY